MLDLGPGATLGQFRILKLLGCGGQTFRHDGFSGKTTRSYGRDIRSTAYLADGGIRGEVALKVLHNDCEGHDACCTRFFREAQCQALLPHPNIVPLYDMGEASGFLYLAMAYVPGETLAARLNRDIPIDFEEALRITIDIGRALDFMHKREAIHRNVSPHNILRDESGRAYLADFCAARLLASEMTRTGLVQGTQQYMAPEQIMGSRVDGRCDVFSLGVVAYELFTGRRPFAGNSLHDMFFNTLQEPAPPPPRYWNGDLPPSYDDAFARVLAKNPHERYASGGAFVSALAERLPNAPQPT